MANQQKPHLLTLPLELRHQIYSYTFSGTETPFEAPTKHPLLQTNSQLRSEATAAYYSDTTFTIHVASNIRVRSWLAKGHELRHLWDEEEWTALAGIINIPDFVRKQLKDSEAVFKNIVFKMYDSVHMVELKAAESGQLLARIRDECPELEEEDLLYLEADMMCHDLEVTRVADLRLSFERKGMERAVSLHMSPSDGPAVEGSSMAFVPRMLTEFLLRSEREHVEDVFAAVNCGANRIMEGGDDQEGRRFTGLSLADLEALALKFRFEPPQESE